MPEVSAKDMPVLSKAFGEVCFQSWAFPTFRPSLEFISTGNNNNKKKNAVLTFLLDSINSALLAWIHLVNHIIVKVGKVTENNHQPVTTILLNHVPW